MNPPPAPLVPPLIRPRAKRFWNRAVLAVTLIPFVVLAVLAVGVISYFHLSSDTRMLRSELTRASGAEWRQQIGLNIGSVTLGLARAGLSFAPLDPEARVALRAVRGVEVGIYQLASGSKRPDRTAMLNAADGVMRTRGWERVVGVLDHDQLVGVYLPAKITSARRMKACVMVLDGHQMVVVSARADLEPLLECLRNQTDWHAKMHSLASR